MSQQINLLSVATKANSGWFTLINVALVYASFAGAMIWQYVDMQSDVQLANEARNHVVAEYEAAQTKMNALTAQAQQTNTSNVDDTIKTLEAKQGLLAKLLDAFSGADTSKHFSVADYLTAFAEQKIPDVWLTGFSVTPQQKLVTIKGRSLSADLIPAYVNSLGKSTVFKGTYFSGIDFKEANIETAGQTQSNAVAAPVTNATPASAGSSTVATSTPAVNATVTATAQPLKVLEFSLKGFDASTLEGVAPLTSAEELVPANASATSAQKGGQ